MKIGNYIHALVDIDDSKPENWKLAIVTKVREDGHVLDLVFADGEERNWCDYYTIPLTKTTIKQLGFDGATGAEIFTLGEIKMCWNGKNWSIHFKTHSILKHPDLETVDKLQNLIKANVGIDLKMKE